MKYSCIKDFDPTGSKVGDTIDIVKTNEGYVIDECATLTAATTYEFFKKYKIPGFKYAPYSFSKIDSFQSCPNKFNYNYIIRPEREQKQMPHLEAGSLIHSIIEQEIGGNLEDFEPEADLTSLTREGAELTINKALTFIDESAIYAWIKSLKGVFVPEQEMFLGPDMKPVDTLEESLIRGFIDLIIWDEKTNSCYIFDWKSGGKSSQALKKFPKPKDQLEMYAIWAYETYGAEHIECAFVYVEHEHMAKYAYSADDIPTLKKKFLAKIDAIEKEEKFPDTYSILCLYCDFKELCLGIPQDTDPKSMTKDDVFDAARKKKGSKPKKSNSKNSAFLSKLKSRNS